MTTLYRPVLIESAEQAEALPEGTLARHDDHMPVEKWRDEYGGTHWGYIEESVEVDLLLGWTALVPIEAEEEWTAMGSDNGEPWVAHVGHDGIDGTREEAQQYVDRFGGFVAHRTRTPWEEAQ